MSIVASATVVNGNHDAGKGSNPEHSPSHFTAVNGRENPSVPGFNGPSNLNATVDENVESRDSLEGDRGPAPRPSTPSRQEEKFPESTNGTNQDQDERNVTSDGCSTSMNRNKRKRSESNDHQSSPPTSYHGHSVPRSPIPRPEDNSNPQMRPFDANGAAHALSGPESEPSMTKVLQPGYVHLERTDGIRTPSNNPTWEGYDSQHPGHSQLNQHMDSSDAQLAEALQRDVQGHDNAPKDWGTAIRGVDESVDVNHRKFTNYSQERSQPAVQVGPKRKRVFSNRTKTGCMTCRRRKKKCDEQHPSCNNCLRGGFLCEGYSSRSTWQKPSNTKGPVPLQSKEGYTDGPSPYIHEMSPQRHERGPGSGPTEGGKTRPIPVDETDRSTSQYITSPTGPGSRGSWSKNTWSAPAPSSYMPEHPSKTEFRDAPVNDIPRTEPPKSDYHVVHPVRELSHGTHAKPGMPIFQSGIDQRPGHPGHVDSSNYPTQARMALNMEPHVPFEPSGKTEKEKMLSGEQYRPFDPQLVKERDRCKAALWRFNNAGNPLAGISGEERNRLLKSILIPPDSFTDSSSATPSGSLGPGAQVEAPFNCHYGYNINIGEDVLISENCSLADDCAINIGAHTWIGPNVTILSSMAIGSMQERKGSQSRYQGRPVVIAEDCWIGAGCTILPGVSLGRGAYIAPGEVVRSQILPYGFQGLKPNYP